MTTGPLLFILTGQQKHIVVITYTAADCLDWLIELAATLSMTVARHSKYMTSTFIYFAHSLSPPLSLLCSLLSLARLSPPVDSLSCSFLSLTCLSPSTHSHSRSFLSPARLPPCSRLKSSPLDHLALYLIASPPLSCFLPSTSIIISGEYFIWINLFQLTDYLCHRNSFT